jgi:hypothetical protein
MCGAGWIPVRHSNEDASSTIICGSDCGLEVWRRRPVSPRNNGRPVRTRTADLYRVNLAGLDFTTTLKTAGTAKVR